MYPKLSKLLQIRSYARRKAYAQPFCLGSLLHHTEILAPNGGQLVSERHADATCQRSADITFVCAIIRPRMAFAAFRRVLVRLPAGVSTRRVLSCCAPTRVPSDQRNMLENPLGRMPQIESSQPRTGRSI
jgi:hypothetical protein